MVRHLLTPYAARLMTSERVRRWRDFPDRLRQRLTHQKPRVTLFHQLDDPYSYLAAEASSLLVQRYDIELDVFIVHDEPVAANNGSGRASENWIRYRLHDARRLARAWRLDEFVQVDHPDAEGLKTSLRCLAGAPPVARAKLAIELTRALWSGDQQKLAQLLGEHRQGSDDDARRLLTTGANERAARGHYKAGMWEFNGDWFWGLDRLEYLEMDLQRWKLARTGNSIHGEYYTPTRVPRFKASTLDAFFSFRSPYSYLCLERLRRLQRQYASQITLRMRPVLPMVERGVALSKDKRKYILQDSARVANKHEIAFGLIQDPLGPGLHRCIALFYYARDQRREFEFAHSVMKGIWAEGVDIHSNRGLRKLTERAGLDWNEAREAAYDDAVQEKVDNNRKQLELMGLWGVPTFALTDTHNRLVDVFWGQDRLPWIEYGLSSPRLSP